MNHALVKSRPNWAALNEQWTRSGLRQKEFCRQHGVSYNSFLKERRRHLQASAGVEHPASSFAEFIPVSIEPPARAATPEIVVELPRGVTIRIRGLQTS
jgi:hypothetical protein